MNKKFYIIPLVLLCGCQNELKIETLKNKSPEEIYKIGKSYEKRNKNEDAVLAFEEVERQYPYSNLVANAQIAAGETYYKMRKYDSATTALESFIQVNPTHDQVPYALYLLGSIYYDQIPIIQRDQDNTFKALEYFQELCNRYPNSEYIPASREKIRIVIQQLATKEARTGRYYQKRKNFPAAIYRFNTVIETYPNTEIAKESMLRLIECYLATGLTNEAKAVYDVMNAKYPNSKWLKYARKIIERK